MSFNIPGYFLDLKTNKYYKITSTGPYSMSALKKRLAEEEEGQRIAKTKRSKPPLTLADFRRKRATVNNYTLEHSSNSSTFMAGLKHRSTIVLDASFRDPKVVFAEGIGSMFIASQDCVRYNIGYQMNPCFHIWKRGMNGNTIKAHSTITSMHYTSNKQREYGTLSISSTDGHFMRTAVTNTPELSQDEVWQLVPNETAAIQDGRHFSIFPARPTNEFVVEASFSAGRDMIWSSAVDYSRNKVIIGGEKSLYQLTGDLRFIRARKMKSAAFDVQLSREQKKTGFAGLRNGNVLLFDVRSKRLEFEAIFKASSSVTNIVEMGNHQLLSVSLNGSIDVWDKRKAHSEPISRLVGNVNEATHNLAFDIDLKNHLLLASGNDGRVRVWSLLNIVNSQPIWISEKFSKPVTSAKMFIDSQFPNVQVNWMPYSKLKRQNPGVLIFTEENNTTVAKYYSIL